jgi:hypothetical protein
MNWVWYLVLLYGIGGAIILILWLLVKPKGGR